MPSGWDHALISEFSPTSLPPWDDGDWDSAEAEYNDNLGELKKLMKRDATATQKCNTTAVSIYIFSSNQSESTNLSQDPLDTLEAITNALNNPADVSTEGEWPDDGPDDVDMSKWAKEAAQYQAEDHALALKKTCDAAHGEGAMTADLILDIYQQLMRRSAAQPGVPYSKKARFRGQGEEVHSAGGTQYPSVLAGNTMKAMVECQIVDKVDWDCKDNNPVYVAAHSLYETTALHPFGNGNGRMGRLLFVYVLTRHGVPVPVPLVINHSKARTKYVNALKRWDNKSNRHWLAWCALTSLNDRVKNCMTYLEKTTMHLKLAA